MRLVCFPIRQTVPPDSDHRQENQPRFPLGGDSIYIAVSRWHTCPDRLTTAKSHDVGIWHSGCHSVQKLGRALLAFWVDRSANAGRP